MWIKVKEKKPRFYEKVLLWWVNEWIEGYLFKSNKDNKLYWHSWVFREDYKLTDHFIEYWHPLPQPPEEE